MHAKPTDYMYIQHMYTTVLYAMIQTVIANFEANTVSVLLKAVLTIQCAEQRVAHNRRVQHGRWLRHDVTRTLVAALHQVF